MKNSIIQNPYKLIRKLIEKTKWNWKLFWQKDYKYFMHAIRMLCGLIIPTILYLIFNETMFIWFGFCIIIVSMSFIKLDLKDSLFKKTIGGTLITSILVFAPVLFNHNPYGGLVLASVCAFLPTLFAHFKRETFFNWSHYFIIQACYFSSKSLTDSIYLSALFISSWIVCGLMFIYIKINSKKENTNLTFFSCETLYEYIQSLSFYLTENKKNYKESQSQRKKIMKCVEELGILILDQRSKQIEQKEILPAMIVLRLCENIIGLGVQLRFLESLSTVDKHKTKQLFNEIIHFVKNLIDGFDSITERNIIDSQEFIMLFQSKIKTFHNDVQNIFHHEKHGELNTIFKRFDGNISAFDDAVSEFV